MCLGTRSNMKTHLCLRFLGVEHLLQVRQSFVTDLATPLLLDEREDGLQLLRFEMRFNVGWLVFLGREKVGDVGETATTECAREMVRRLDSQVCSKDLGDESQGCPCKGRMVA